MASEFADFSSVSDLTNDFLDVMFARKYALTQVRYIELLYCLALVPGLLAIRFVVSEYVCHPLAQWLNIKNKQVTLKVGESLWKAGWCLTSSSTGFAIGLYYNLFTEDLHNAWFPPPAQQRIDPYFRLFYMVQMAYFVQNMYNHLRATEKRKDHLLMCAHHMIAIVLIVGSYITGYFRSGLIVFLVHDFTDFLLEFTKINAYAKTKLATPSFIVMMIGWLSLRLVYFPLYFLTYTPWVTELKHPGMDVADHYPFRGCIRVCLWSLTFMHAYWFQLMVKMAYGMLTKGGGVKDTREESDGSDASDDGEPVEAAHPQLRKR